MRALFRVLSVTALADHYMLEYIIMCLHVHSFTEMPNTQAIISTPRCAGTLTHTQYTVTSVIQYLSK